MRNKANASAAIPRCRRTSAGLVAALTACMAAGIAACLTTTALTADFQLITPSEAALPPAMIVPLQLRGSPTRRPHIIIVSPPRNAGLVHSPLELKLRFRAFGGAQIDPDSVVLTYLKQPAIDLTQRIKPFIKASGVDITHADVPPGKHHFWIELKDKDGRIGGTDFSFDVAK
jgi:hypothetical protein